MASRCGALDRAEISTIGRQISEVIDLERRMATTRSEPQSLVPFDHEFFLGAYTKPQIAATLGVD